MSKIVRIGGPVSRDITVRNLIYHVYARKGSTAWHANLKQLQKRWNLFNGRRIIGVAEDDISHGAGIIRDILGPDAEYLPVPNDPRLAELTTFAPMLRAVANLNHYEATFYAHTKGTKPPQLKRSELERDEGIMFWRNTMYHRLLDDWPAVHEQLRKSPMCGMFKIDWRTWDTEIFGWNYYPSGLVCGKWMYAGTYYWFRHDMTFAHPRAFYPADDKYGAESWPARLWTADRCPTIHQPWPADQFPNPNIYLPETYDASKGWDRIAD